MAASRIFSDEFFKRQTAGKYQHHNHPEAFLDPEKISILFRKKLLYYSKIHREVLIELQGTNKQRILLHFQTKQRYKYVRRRSRRQDSLDIRLRTVGQHPEWSPEWGNIVKELGVAGMSSDETDTENKTYPPRFYRIPKQWRSTHITLLLCVIDRAYRKSSPLGNQPGRTGNLRRLRMGNHPTKIHDTPKPDYPSTFYDQEFLRKKRPGSFQLLQTTSAWNKPFPLPTSTALGDEADDWNQGTGPSN
ncbi:hypothetical protein K439DRAFT_279503 [Ramaria rubella]|nr:hypothetical protein K439DRAFT_279503 [Ramaria rubella]